MIRPPRAPTTPPSDTDDAATVRARADLAPGHRRGDHTASRGRREALRLLGALVLAPHAQGTAVAGELRVVTGTASDATAEIVAAITRRFPAAPASADARQLSGRGGAGVYLAVGPAALQAALDADVAGPIVSAFVSSQTYRRLRAAAPAARQLTGVYAEASPAAQMQLVRKLYRRRVTVAVLLGPASRPLRPLLEQAAAAADLALAVAEVRPGDNPLRALAAIDSASVLLVVPDPDVYNGEIVRALLESTYRRRQGVIGFSRAMVSAGTLAAAYATIEDVVAQLGGLVESLAIGQAPEAQYPLYWRVAINESVARSLDVVVDASARALGNFPA